MVTRSALIYLSRQEGLKDFAARFRPFRKLTTRFVAGENIDEAIAAIRELNAEGCSASFDHLNESVSSPSEAEAEVKEYLTILDRIEATQINSNVSIKLTQFGLELDPELAYQNARRSFGEPSHEVRIPVFSIWYIYPHVVAVFGELSLQIAPDAV